MRDASASAGIRRGMKTFRQSSVGIGITFFSVLFVSLISLSAISFAEEGITEASAESSMSSKGISWIFLSKLILFKASFLEKEEKVQQLLDLSKRYVDDIEAETNAHKREDAQKTKQAYASVLEKLQEELDDVSSDTRIEVEQELTLQEQRLEYLAASVSHKGSNDPVTYLVGEAYDQSKHLLKSLSKEKRKEAILKARETNKSDEEVENETEAQEQNHSQEFEVKAAQFIAQAEHSITKVEEKIEKKQLSENTTPLSAIKEASAILHDAKEAYNESDYIAAIELAFQAKHAALKAQTALSTYAIHGNAEVNVIEQPNLVKKVEVKESAGIESSSSQSSIGNTLTGQVIAKESPPKGKKDEITGDVSTGSSVVDTASDASNDNPEEKKPSPDKDNGKDGKKEKDDLPL